MTFYISGNSIRRLATAARFLLWLTVLLAAPSLAAQTNPYLEKQLEGVKVTEKLGNVLPLQLEFRDEDNRPVTLGDFFRKGRPVLLTLNYSDCPMLCSLQLTELSKLLKEIEWAPGLEFEIITLSIDPAEAPSRAKRSRKRYVGESGSPEYARGWHFLTTTDESAIKAVADAVGFGYVFVPETGEYKHKAALFTITPEGRVSGYLHGIAFEPGTLEGALQSAATGEIGAYSATMDDSLYPNCFSFIKSDNANAAMMIVRIGGAAGLGLLLLLTGFLVFRGSRREKAAKLETSR